MATTSRGRPTAAPAGPCSEEKAREAMAMMIEALELIDSSAGAGVAGAHLDLAIHRLREWIDAAAPR